MTLESPEKSAPSDTSQRHMVGADARSGTTVGKYRLHEIVGRGGMGVVYRAEHVYIGREVAVKILHEGYGAREDAIKRFLREARAASLINHPNIVEVTDFGKATDGTVFFVMELLVGEPLDAILARERRLDLLRAITICNQLAAALGAAHSKNIIHRDLKSENVMLIPREGRRELVRRIPDESGGHEVSERETKFDFVKILDFGVAKVHEPEAQKRVTQAGVVFGTPEYMAPETARVGFSDARSDIYALGVMFYEMLTGVVPFTGEAPVDVMIKQVNDRVPPMRDVAPDAEITEETEHMILKALAKDPDQRQQSMQEFHRDLQKCYGQLRFRRVVKTPASPPQTTEPPPTRAETPQRTPPAEAIPLVKRKSPSPGALPTSLRSAQSSSIEQPVQGDAGKPAVPGASGTGVTSGGASPAAPILLTKKKAPRANLGPWPAPTPTTTPPPQPAQGSSPTTTTTAADAPSESRPRRATLPLGTTAAPPVAGRVGFPTAMDDTPLVPAKPLPGAPETLGPVVTTMAADRPTPRISIHAAAEAVRARRRSDAPDAEQSWGDESTAPGVSETSR